MANQLPANQTTISFDNTKMAAISGREEGSGYRMPLDRLTALIKAVRFGYSQVALAPGSTPPNAESVFRANERHLTKALQDVFADAKSFGWTQVPLPVTDNDGSKLWGILKDLLGNPDKFGAKGYKPLTTLVPAGKSSK